MSALQGTEEWFAERLGRVTASSFSDVLAKGEGVTRKRYMRRLVAERLTGRSQESFSNGHTERGAEQEQFARLQYEAMTGNLVTEVGFIKHPTLFAGASPDGLIDDDGGQEIKSVVPTVHIETMERGKYPTTHKAQIQGCLWITGRQWWDFVSYSPDFLQENLRLYIFRVQRDEEYIANLEVEVVKFLKEVDEMVERVSSFDFSVF
ncbi:MAG: lambda exonuclease family protein [Devosia sp.]